MHAGLALKKFYGLAKQWIGIVQLNRRSTGAGWIHIRK